MKSLSSLAFGLSMLIGTLSFAAGALPTAELLWPNGAPNATGDSLEDKPAIYAFLPEPSKATGAAMLVMPGGGFQTRVTDQEGTLVAQWLRERGIASFVLRYRIRPIGQKADSVNDAHRAMRYLRTNAERFKIDPNRIGAIGFSAGAELAAAAGFAVVQPSADSTDPVDRQASNFNFIVLSYGTDGTPIPEVPAKVPPVFMFCTAEDTSHLNPMLATYTKLRQAKVPVEVHFFANGEHGVGLAQGDPVLGEWPNLMFNWIRANGFLSASQRIALKGMAMLDGEPLPRGLVVLTPVDNPGAPIIPAYVFNTGPVRGQFELPAAQGPIPGKYKVEMHQYATRWMSNAQEPFIVSINAKGRNLSDQDKQDYLKFARARDLEPTIDKERVFSTAHPGDKEPVIVEVKPNGEPIKIEMFRK